MISNNRLLLSFQSLYLILTFLLPQVVGGILCYTEITSGNWLIYQKIAPPAGLNGEDKVTQLPELRRRTRESNYADVMSMYHEWLELTSTASMDEFFELFQRVHPGQALLLYKIHPKHLKDYPLQVLEERYRFRIVLQTANTTDDEEKAEFLYQWLRGHLRATIRDLKQYKERLVQAARDGEVVNQGERLPNKLLLQVEREYRHFRESKENEVKVESAI